MQQYFLKTQKCKFGIQCKFNHPKYLINLQGAPDSCDASVLPERPSEPPCAFYMKTGQCKFGATCKFHHPKGVQIQSVGEDEGNYIMSKMVGDTKPSHPLFTPAIFHNSKGLPIRPGIEDCPFFLKTGSCKYGTTCRYNHPNRIVVDPQTTAIVPGLLSSASKPFNVGAVAPGASLLSNFDPSLTQTAIGLRSTTYPQRPGQMECDYYMKTGVCKFGDTCKFHHPIDRSAPTSSEQQNVKLTLAGLPRREGAIHCPFYMKTGTCKYGSTCKFDHPPPGELISATTSQGLSDSSVGEEKDNGKNA